MFKVYHLSSPISGASWTSVESGTRFVWGQPATCYPYDGTQAAPDPQTSFL